VRGDYDRDGVWRRCTRLNPMCWGRAIRDDCTCRLKPDPAREKETNRELARLRGRVAWLELQLAEAQAKLKVD